jgi:hypothetical protein
MSIYLCLLEYWHSFLPGVDVTKTQEGRGNEIYLEMLKCTFGKDECFGLIILNPLKLS